MARDFAFDAPARIEAGLVHFRLVNVGSDIHEVVVTRVTEPGGSAARYLEQWKQEVYWPRFARDVGGAGLTQPGDSSEVWLRLEPGHYVLICTKGDHLNRGMAADLEVVATEASISEPPKAGPQFNP